MRRVVINKKGGVGKTTIVCNLAAIAAERGRRTLVVDLDPQANATQYLLGEGAADLERTVADLFAETLSGGLFGGDASDPATFVTRTPIPGLDLLPAHRDLETLRLRLETRFKIYKLREALRDLGYDEVFIDTPPSLGFYTISALIAAQRCLIPFDCDEFARNALYELKGHVREVAGDHNRELELEGVVVNQFQSRARLPAEIIATLEREGFPVLRPFLGASVRIRESHRAARPLVVMAPRHRVSVQFRELFEAIDHVRPPAAGA
ncbi:MAG: ParA family protein [Acidobacteriota bacterium]